MIEPKILKGTRDFGPDEMAKRAHVLGILQKTFERFGYGTIETPVIEYAETILGKYGEEGDKLTYHFQDNGDRHIALRYDQTVPFARYYATNWQELPSPFKRYQISRVWRADKPQRGRYREFYQCDIDIIGTTALTAELELLQIIQSAYVEMGLKDYEIQFNDRALMNSMLEAFGVEENKKIEVIRALDKLDKIGRDGVFVELDKANLSAETKTALLDLVLTEGTNDERVAAFSKFNVGAIKEILALAEAGGVNTNHLKFNPALARGLDYYTGFICEVLLADDRALGATCSGGRYDDLCGLFCKQNFSGVGVAFGFDRLMVALTDRGLLENINAAPQVLVVNFGLETVVENIKLAKTLRNAGINTDFYFEEDKLAKQFKYADKKGIPYVVVQGADEIKKGVVMLKNMQNGDQKELKTADLPKAFA